MSAIVCLATYNGARWLQEQIDSVIAQSDKDWRLLISDDGSSDATLDIVNYNLNRDSRLRLLPSRSGKQGVVGNFEYLLHEAKSIPADFVALCDQDDVWHHDKLLRQREGLKNFSACCSDLMLTNAVGEPTGVRLLRQLSAPDQPLLCTVLAQNSVVGCTLAVKPEVLDIALPFPQGLVNHDWWLALCALSIETVFCEAQPLVNYRQHDANVVGAYKPLRQLQFAPKLLARQRRVLCSQLSAVKTLKNRLLQRNVEPPPDLERYLFQVGSDSLKERWSALAHGEFAAPHKPLRALRLAASLKNPN